MEILLLGLNIVGALVALGFGLISFFQPKLVANAFYFTLENGLGRSEVRIALGGFFIGMALWALITLEPIAFQVVGAAWMGAAIARIASAFIDQHPLKGGYLAVFFLELLMGVFLFL